MNETDSIGIENRFVWCRRNKLTNYQISLIIEEYLSDKSINLEKLAVKYNVSMCTVSRLITEILFNRPENPLTITLKSAV